MVEGQHLSTISLSMIHISTGKGEAKLSHEWWCRFWQLTLAGITLLHVLGTRPAVTIAIVRPRDLCRVLDPRIVKVKCIARAKVCG